MTFEPGNRIRVRASEKPGHVRTPGYLKGKKGRVESVLGALRNADDAWNYLLDEERKIGYIRVVNFGRHTADELRSALGELKRGGMRGLILDLRFNPGGLLSAAIEVGDLQEPLDEAGVVRECLTSLWTADDERRRI